MVKDTVLYDRLDVTPNASTDDISKAFKLLARKYHPDKHSAETKEEMTLKFQEILQAKEILLDKDKRNTYDQVGMDMLNGNNEAPDVHDFFKHFQSQFNPFGGFGGQRESREPREDIKLQLNVTLTQLYNSETLNVPYKYKCVCVKCNGEGTRDGKSCVCTTCNGVGVVARQIQMGPMIQIVQMHCSTCKGAGKHANDNNKCDGCSGKTYTMKEKTISVPLKPGLTTGSEVPFPNKGHQLKNHKTDLIFVLNEVPHLLYKRVNNDLILNIELKLYQALFGFDKMIEHLDGKKMHLHFTGRTEFNQVRKIIGQGMKSINTSAVGDLYIRFTINIPNLNNLSSDTKQEYKKIFAAFDKTEASNELSIISEKEPIVTLSECKDKERKQVTKILIDEQFNTDERDHDENSRGEKQCVHQ